MVKKDIKVLVVDDERMICGLLNNALGEWGYLCTTAPSGRHALQELEKQRFDIVLLDIRLPGMSGMEVLQELWLNHTDTAVIMITGINDIGTAVQAMKLGASDYIVKPLDLDKIDSSIQAALKAKQAAQKPSAEMDAIARGVEAGFDPLSGYLKKVTRRTVEIARQLGVAEEEIQQWVAAREKSDYERSRLLRFSEG